MKNLSVANRWNADLIDQQYDQWLSNPDSLEPEWRAFFEGYELAQTTTTGATTDSDTSFATGTSDSIVQSRVIGAIYAYRSIGHTQADFNPLKKESIPNPRLTMERLGLSEADLSKKFHTGNYLGGQFIPLKALLEQLDNTYCGHVGCEYIHIQETSKRRWLQAKMEPSENQPDFPKEQKVRILRKVMEAEMFERFLHTRYVGQKRFSLEGGETAIAALDAIIEACPEHNIDEVIMGMSHRGRLNALANILGKSYEYIFREFSENYIPDTIHGDGDVKYHLGYEKIRSTEAGKDIEIRLAANPSHLEAVDPVVQGKARARQRIRDDMERKRVLPLLIHGDAAFAGQGVVAETLNLSRLKGYTTGGTIHLIINNQIGFTTDPRDARSTRYCTDIAKMIEVPIFHVNGEDPLAVVMVMLRALEYRQTYGDDVVIDMYCYRKHGHNESDEPGFTQPDLYRRISQRECISDILRKRLLEDGSLTEKQAEQLKEEYQNTLNDAFTRVKNGEPAKKTSKKKKSDEFVGSSAVFQPPYDFEPAKTGVAKTRLTQVAKALTSVPPNFKLNPKIKRQLENKWKNFQAGENIDWSFAEQMAFGTLMLEGTPVRLSGQDSERGTFSQRHSAFYDTESRIRYVPLLNLGEGQARFCVHNSSLSEAAVLGFDFGYSLDYPEMLGLWEAQFGDFANGAQVHIDQFITSSESKWARVSGLVLLLPHGYEGQGPEHSSGRLERWLQACAEDNIQVCNLSTPAQYFHVLRRQMKRAFRKPLIIMAPKSMLRSKDCVSKVDELSKGHFEEILDDPEAPAKPERVVLCSGKVYYDLLKYRRDHKKNKTAILRVEQLYPVNKKRLKALTDKYASAKSFVWCQEEPQNMGSWSFIFHYLLEATGKIPEYAGRGSAASPAPGSLAVHKIEQEALVEEAFVK